MFESVFILGIIFGAYVLSLRNDSPEDKNKANTAALSPVKPSSISAAKTDTSKPVPTTKPKMTAAVKAPAKTRTPSVQKPLKTAKPKPKAATKNTPKPTVARPKKILVTTPNQAPAATVVSVEHIPLKNPVTGEVAAPYRNYRFAKRWLKEALVAEGLAEKIYKNNELDVTIEASLSAAVKQLEQIEKYHR